MAEEKKLVQRLTHTIVFNQVDNDFMFQYYLSNMEHHGAAFGELWNIARRVDEKNDLSWKAEFMKEAVKIETLAEDCLKKGHKISGGNAYLRAYTYYRAAFCSVAPGDPDHDPIYWKMTGCFKKGIGAKSDLIPHEWLTVEYNGHKFPGCFFKVDNSDKPRPTIYLHNGGETHAEDHYFMYVQPALDRGYNALILDGPWDPCGRFYAPDATIYTFPGDVLADCWRKVTDMLLARPDVDPKRLVVAGESYGGAKTMYHASTDDRFAAVVANSPIIDFPHMLQLANEELPIYRNVSAEVSNALVDKIPFNARVSLKRVMWFHGMKSLVEWIPNLQCLKVDCSKIKAPFLSMYSESEAPEFIRQAKVAMQEVSSEFKAEAVGTLEDGADLHCQLNNLARGTQLMFDWLDDVLNYRIEK